MKSAIICLLTITSVSSAQVRTDATYEDVRKRVASGEKMTLSVGIEYPSSLRCDEAKDFGVPVGVYECFAIDGVPKMRDLGVVAPKTGPGPVKKLLNRTVDKLLELHNRERVARNLPALVLDETLCQQSANHSLNQAVRGIHHSKGGFAGENVAAGQSSEDEVTRDWMNSLGHRRNILNSNYTKVGFGRAVGNNGVVYWTTQFGQ